MFVVITETPRKGRGNTRHVYGLYSTRSSAIAAVGKGKRENPQLWQDVDYTVHKVLINDDSGSWMAL